VLGKDSLTYSAVVGTSRIQGFQIGFFGAKFQHFGFF